MNKVNFAKMILSRLAFSGALVACGWIAAVHATESNTPWLKQGAEILLPFKQQLQQALQQGMADGPVVAVNVCHLDAPLIAQVSAGDNVRVGRSSHRLRNPANTPAPWMNEIISQYLADPATQRPVVVQLAGGRVGYAEPILTQSQCLICHGEDIAPAVRNSIKELYPADEAMGFQVGDLRGIFWTEFDAAQ